MGREACFGLIGRNCKSGNFQLTLEISRRICNFMKIVNPKHSYTELEAFLDHLESAGVMPKSTIRARRASLNKVSTVLTREEWSDVLNLDLEEVGRRFAKMRGGNYTEDSLKSYLSRVRVTIEEFQLFLGRWGRSRPERLTGDLPKKPVKGQPTYSKSIRENSVRTARFEVSILPVPIREDLTVQIQGLPFDLSKAEANKIANVILAMAT